MFNSTKNNYHQLVRREYGLFSSLNQHSMVKKNISEGNCSKTIFNKHTQGIIALAIKDHYVATASDDGKVILWNLVTRKIEWVRDYNLAHCLTWGIFKIAGDCLILSSKFIDDGKSIKIVDFETGIEIQTIKISDLNASKICVVGERIFAGLARFYSQGILNDYALREWSVKGDIVKTLKYSKPLGSYPTFIGSHDFVVDIVNYRIVFIHQLQKNNTVELSLLNAIRCAQIDQKRLFCGTGSSPHVVIIDMEKNQITHELIFSELGQTNIVKSILVQNDNVYFGFDTGHLIACVLNKRPFRINIGKNSSQVDSLALQGNLLMSASRGDFKDSLNKPGEVNFWDVRTLKKVSGLICDTPFLLNVSLADHRVLATNQGSLIEWDYLVAHRGEQLTGESATKITSSSQECVIQ